MILVDTSVWIDHLRGGDARLSERLTRLEVLAHPLVIEELACGHIVHREEVLRFLKELPRAPIATHEETLAFISREALHGAGLGAVDVHLLASAKLARAPVWSRDLALAKAAKRLGVFTAG